MVLFLLPGPVPKDGKILYKVLSPGALLCMVPQGDTFSQFLFDPYRKSLANIILWNEGTLHNDDIQLYI